MSPSKCKIKLKDKKRAQLYYIIQTGNNGATQTYNVYNNNRCHLQWYIVGRYLYIGSTCVYILFFAYTDAQHWCGHRHRYTMIYDLLRRKCQLL